MTAVMYMGADTGTRAEMLGNIVGAAGPFVLAGGVVSLAGSSRVTLFMNCEISYSASYNSSRPTPKI